jgi:hypothetical protein
MCAKSKALWFALFPALLLALLVLRTDPGRAVVCDNKKTDCYVDCSRKAYECGRAGSKNYRQCLNDCAGICDLRASDCEAGRGPWAGTAEKPPRKPVPPTKVQPKVKPGGAETPGTESPNVQPKGGIQRY